MEYDDDLHRPQEDDPVFPLDADLAHPPISPPRPLILIGGTYQHLASRRLVTVLDNEYDHERPRPPTEGAQTGRYVVRFIDGFAGNFIAAPTELAPHAPHGALPTE